MVVLDVYSKSLKVIYKSRLCSKATVFILVTSILSIVIPFIFAYNSRGFWIKHDTFYEQPDVKFRGEYLFNAITSNLSSPVVCSSFQYFTGFSMFDKCSLIKAREIDNNKDGKVDELDFSINIDTQTFKILSFNLLLAFDYSLHTICPAMMQSALIVQHNVHSFTTSEVAVIADMGLSQTSSLVCHKKWTNKQYNQSVIQNKLGVYNYDIKSIIQDYSKRNLSTHLVNKYTTYSAGNGETELFVKLRIRFPQHKIYYTPSFWQVIKWAWIQYFMIYIIFAWIVQEIRSYVFRNKLLLFYEVSPLKKIK